MTRDTLAQDNVTQHVLAHYTRHSLLSDPGPYAAQLGSLPEDLDVLCRAINGVFIHVWKVRKFYPEELGRRPYAVFVRSVRSLLGHALALDAAPLNVVRPERERAVIDCRSFALLLCAVLRERGVPARVRCGFASYLEPTHLQDHWICEFWNGERWLTEDPDVIKHDLLPDDFITGARAWALVRAGERAAEAFGYAPEPYSRGPFAVRLNLLHDVAALCGAESVSGDVWGFALRGKREFPGADVKVMDEAARSASADTTLPALWRFYTSQPGLAMPDAVQHYDYVKGGQSLIRWREC